MSVCQFRALRRDTGDNGEEGKHTWTKNLKKQESQTRADQQTWGRIYVYDPALPPRVLLHAETSAYPADHTLPHRSV